MKKKPIVIVGVMESELAHIQSQLTGQRAYQRGDYHVVEGFFCDYPIVIAQCYVGRMVNAAAATALAIDTYAPLCVLTEGTAGGHNPELHVGDIVLGERFLEIGCYQTPHRRRGEGISVENRVYSVEDMLPDAIPEMPVSCDRDLLELAQSVPYETGKLICGTIASSGQWNREVDMIDFYHETLGSDCEDMESLAVVNVANRLGVPALAIRVISDSELHDEAFDERYGLWCQEYVLNLLKRIIKNQNA